MKKLSIVLALLISCATTKEVAKDTLAIGKICAEESIIEKASQIVPAIKAILTTPGSSWKEQAEMYMKAYGKEVAICAGRTALEKLISPVQSEGNPVDPEEVKKTAQAREREFELEAGISN